MNNPHYIHKTDRPSRVPKITSVKYSNKGEHNITVESESQAGVTKWLYKTPTFPNYDIWHYKQWGWQTIEQNIIKLAKENGVKTFIKKIK